MRSGGGRPSPGVDKSSGGKTERTPTSKQRNKQLQTILVAAAKLAPRWSTERALVYEREKQRGNRKPGHTGRGGANWWLMRLVLPRKPQ